MTNTPTNPATETIEPVVKTRTVPLEPEAAFDLFARRMGEWWPTEGFSIAGDEVVAIEVEERVDGQVLEVTIGGEHNAWADVTAWEPPHRLALAWHPGLATSSDLEVAFTAVDGGTQVRIVHTGWERFGDRGTDLRNDYDSGWDLVLGRYTAAAEG